LEEVYQLQDKYSLVPYYQPTKISYIEKDCALKTDIDERSRLFAMGHSLEKSVSRKETPSNGVSSFVKTFVKSLVISPQQQVNSMDAETYFSRLATLLKDNPFHDPVMIKKLVKIGIIPGQDFKTHLDLEEVPRRALQIIKNHGHISNISVNNWTYSLQTGQYGTDYLQRAYIAFNILGANRPKDAIYATSVVDNHNQLLFGSNKYVIHFDEFPPVKGFWSITVYDKNNFLIDNPLNRYSLGSSSHLNSSVIYLQSTNPGGKKKANWLPVPNNGVFKVMMRLYWPIFGNQWRFPPILLTERDQCRPRSHHFQLGDHR
jgi:hypothetical protein